jgi:hypothetical protein
MLSGGYKMKSYSAMFILTIIAALFLGSCVTTKEESESPLSDGTLEVIEEMMVHTFDDPREEARLGGRTSVWPEEVRLLEAIDLFESNVFIGTETDSPDETPYLSWNSVLEYNPGAFAGEDADIDFRLNFFYSPIFTRLAEFKADGIFISARASRNLPVRISFHGDRINAGNHLILYDQWQTHYLPFSNFEIHKHDQGRQIIKLDEATMHLFWELSIGNNISYLVENGYLSKAAETFQFDVDINHIGLYRIAEPRPANIIEDFDGKILHYQFDGARIGIFSQDEEERRRADIIFDRKIEARLVKDGSGADGTPGYYSFHTKFRVGEMAAALSRDSTIGFHSRFRGDVDMSDYGAIRFKVRVVGLRGFWIDINNQILDAGINRGVEVIKENEWFEVELPLHTFNYDDQLEINTGLIESYFSNIHEIRFNFGVPETTGWNGDWQDKSSFTGSYDAQIDIDNIELVGNMPPADEFIRLVKESKKDRDG